MGKYLKQGFVRKLEWKLNREEISYSKWVDLMEEECIKNFSEEIIDIIDSENSGLSAEQRLDEINRLIKDFNIKER
jgi:vacuolar-type H+-ATPase catalytic subunit A/Vma1